MIKGLLARGSKKGFGKYTSINRSTELPCQSTAVPYLMFKREVIWLSEKYSCSVKRLSVVHSCAVTTLATIKKDTMSKLIEFFMCLNCLELRKLFATHQMDFYEETSDERHNRSHPEFPGQLVHFIFKLIELIINLLLLLLVRRAL